MSFTFPDPMGGWIEQDSGVVLYNTTPYAMPLPEVVRRVRDLWEYDYRIRRVETLSSTSAPGSAMKSWF